MAVRIDLTALSSTHRFCLVQTDGILGSNFLRLLSDVAEDGDCDNIETPEH